MTTEVYSQLAGLFTYPDSGYDQRLDAVIAAVREERPRAAELLERYREMLPWRDEPEPLQTMEELYTRSFDVQAVTTLDLGFVVFGDDYKRGELLVNLSREHRVAGTDCGDELGDHLTNLLRLVENHPDREMVAELVGVIIAPGLRQMVAEFDPARQEKMERLYRKHHRTLIDRPATRWQAYRLAIEAVYVVLQEDFLLPGMDARETGPASGFLEAVAQELEIENDEAKTGGKSRDAGKTRTGFSPDMCSGNPQQRTPGSC